MEATLFTTYAPVLRRLTEADMAGEAPPAELLMAQDGPVSMYYAPFDEINREARIILVGITPGRTQMDTALRTASRLIGEGRSDAEVLHGVKQAASFAGSIRTNLVAMLDRFRINDVVGVPTCADLFGASRHLVHYTSALRYPVFVRGANYSGAPGMTRHPLLTRFLADYFASELAILPHALVVPLGEKVSEAINFIAQGRDIRPGRVLSGLEHPSGANNERIAYLIGRKPREALSAMVRPERIDLARAALESKVAALLASPC